MTKSSTTVSGFNRRDALRLMGLGGVASLIAPNLLGAPAFGQTPPAAPTGRVIVGLSQEPTVFNPLMLHIEVDEGVYFTLFDPLLSVDPDGIIRPTSPPRCRPWRMAASPRTASTGASGCATTSSGTTARRSPPRT